MAPYDSGVAETSSIDGDTNDSAMALSAAAPAPREQTRPAKDDTPAPKTRRK